MIVRNCIRYFPDARYTDLATNTTLGTATRHDTPAKTLTIEETGTRTFRSVRIRVYFQDRFTAANEVTGVRLGYKLGAAATTDVDRSFTQANSGDHMGDIWSVDATAYFNANFGAGTTQTLVCSVAVSTTVASNIGGTIWFEVVIDYDYDDTVGTKRMRCIPHVLQSHSTFLTNGAMVEFGTTGGAGSDAPANQIPAWDTFLEETGKTYCDMGMVLYANTGNVAGDTTPSIQVDATGAVNLGLIGQALQTLRVWRGLYNYPFGTHATNAVHAIKAQTNVANTMFAFGGIIWVTYSYDISGTTRGMYWCWPTLNEPGEVDGRGVDRTVSPSDNVAGDASVWELVVDIQEPGTITMKHAGAMIRLVNTAGGQLVYRAGTQSYRTQAAGGSGCEAPTFHRGDHSAGAWTLARGVNKLPISAYQTLQGRMVLEGYGLIVYSADVPSTGPDKGNRALTYVNSSYGTTPALHTIISEGSQSIPPLATPWRMSAFFYETVIRGTLNNTADLPTMLAEMKSGEFQGAGWSASSSLETGSPAELGTAENWHPMTARYYSDSLQFALLAGAKMDPLIARRVCAASATGTMLSAISSTITVHNIGFTVAGDVTVGGVAVANGKTVKVYDAVTGQYLGSTTTGGGTGSFSFTTVQNVNDVFASYVDGGTIGRSADGTADVDTFDVTIPGGGGGGDTTPPTITFISPMPGQSITRQSIITVQATDDVAMRRVFIYANFTKPNSWEVIYDGENFGPAYQGPNNTVTSISGGYEFRILRDGGWQQTPDIRIIPIDAAGNGPA